MSELADMSQNFLLYLYILFLSKDKSTWVSLFLEGMDFMGQLLGVVLVGIMAHQDP